jgi:acetyl esterase/lipase
MRQPIDDIAEGSPTRYAWPGRHVPERQYEEHCLGNTAGAGLPPALVITTQADVVRDEGEAYAGKLRDAGVPVIADRFQAIIHDFVMLNALADTDAARAPSPLLPTRCERCCPTTPESPTSRGLPTGSSGAPWPAAVRRVCDQSR